jgi:hypothetical protein
LANAVIPNSVLAFLPPLSSLAKVSIERPTHSHGRLL